MKKMIIIAAICIPLVYALISGLTQAQNRSPRQSVSGASRTSTAPPTDASGSPTDPGGISVAGQAIGDLETTEPIGKAASGAFITSAQTAPRTVGTVGTSGGGILIEGEVASIDRTNNQFTIIDHSTGSARTLRVADASLLGSMNEGDSVEVTLTSTGSDTVDHIRKKEEQSIGLV
ncbi:MAG: hypothetical protein HY584_01155 [Candidatus Omnitrophica bacterium]|nr:hypothetical protein [Candidatus Omnitrophota bacterium]